MLVHPQARRRGLARALMRRVEQEALKLGRTLLTLDTASDAAERLYRSAGYRCVGVIPRYALNPDGSWCDTTVFYKHLGGESGPHPNPLPQEGEGEASDPA
jgi:ribosomal protein S18 acetylase RimI-like enzyme